MIPELATIRPSSSGIRAAIPTRMVFFETLAPQDSSKALIARKKNLTCQIVWITFLIIKRERLHGRSQ